MPTASGENKLKLSLAYLVFFYQASPRREQPNVRVSLCVMEESKHAVWPVPVGITISFPGSTEN